MQVFPEQSQTAPFATVLLTLQTHEKKKMISIHLVGFKSLITIYFNE